MNSQTTFVLSQSGQQFTVPNAVVTTGTLTVSYTINGSPVSLSIGIEGIQNANGTIAILDSYAGTSSTSRSVALNGVSYDGFRFTAIFTGSNVSVAGSVSTTGPGQAFLSSSLPAVQNFPVS